MSLTRKHCSPSQQTRGNLQHKAELLVGAIRLESTLGSALHILYQGCDGAMPDQHVAVCCASGCQLLYTVYMAVNLLSRSSGAHERSCFNYYFT